MEVCRVANQQVQMELAESIAEFFTYKLSYRLACRSFQTLQPRATTIASGEGFYVSFKRQSDKPIPIEISEKIAQGI